MLIRILFERVLFLIFPIVMLGEPMLKMLQNLFRLYYRCHDLVTCLVRWILW